MKRAVLIAMAFTALAAAPLRAGEGAYPSLEAWGEALFFDTNLSKNRTEACATCHDPAAGFSDPRETVAGRAVSLGDDGASLGDRNAPTASYTRFSPPFGRTADGKWQGGQFHDGRAATLADQAKGPPLNPIEMGMPDVAAVAARLRENPRYVATLAALRPGADDAAAFDAMADALAAYEASDTFSPFDSKYDRFLRGEAKLTDQEELGRLLFFSSQFTNCNLCHQLRGTHGAMEETFSNYQFHNIGVPANRAVRAANGAAPDRVDAGLLENPAVTDPAEAGKIKVPTLRNVAVTGPYMHNGVFADLRTVILFYNSYNTKRPERHINPETGAPFDPPEVAQNLSRTELETGPALDDQRIDALVAFLKTLTDARYEPLLH
ncbi:cytochrome-c peroxidase [Sinirhodobacter huangdaonensis]|uniref:Methylamine utilization protein MauG n=1 Tax=Paenirhodobacter huangdaonensis TaxID=2501515 RepID=A0A3S3PBI6_9RHOB|nr:cytochrome c peroxidase [Sinirhodobacter huangdaonensis]RWR47937.1 methylamine utilization protein MauG [Sinirhodobacter huangdaonensis]